MTLTIITPTAEQWDAYVRQHPRGHVLQLSTWGELKSAFGWSYDRVAITENGQIVGGAQMLFRQLPFRLGTMAYLPFGGYHEDGTSSADLWNAVKLCARKHGAAFLKYEPGLYLDHSAPDLAAQGFRASPQTVQPPNTVVMDIAGDEDVIMARMNQGTRRKIRQSLKNDVHYYEASRTDVDKFTSIMQVTGSRNEFGVHSAAYYQKAYDLFVPRDAALILAEHEGDTLAGVFVFQLGPWAWYLYGASSNEKRNLMASYGVQWKAIQWAKARGAIYYDMWGIPDANEAALEAEFEQRSDGLWGVYGFKRGWGGKVIRSLGAWDRVYNPLIYSAYKLALKVRSHADS
ncbi:MAG: peptidoglycan bridge formation glycyltransferase FemA/FemB family protein [Anaerolineae bacterium]